MAVTIQITSAGSSTSNTLDLYWSSDNTNWTKFDTQTLTTLELGYTFTVPNISANYYQVRDTGACGSILTLSCTTTTTTTHI